MANRPEPIRVNQYYHVYNRGNNKQTLFYERADYERFYATIQRYQVEFSSIQIYAWCFLPNHFHFLMQDIVDSGSNLIQKEKIQVRTLTETPSSIPQFMQKIQQAYAVYFQIKYKDQLFDGKRFPVFQGRYKAKPVFNEEYLAQVKTYIEFNPIKHELVKDINDWEYTSYIPDSMTNLSSDLFSLEGLEF